jgi:hypothetical protein
VAAAAAAAAATVEEEKEEEEDAEEKRKKGGGRMASKRMRHALQEEREEKMREGRRVAVLRVEHTYHIFPFFSSFIRKRFMPLWFYCSLFAVGFSIKRPLYGGGLCYACISSRESSFYFATMSSLEKALTLPWI